MKFGRPRDWTKTNPRKEFVDGIQPVSQPQPRSNNLREWLIIGTRDISESSDEDEVHDKINRVIERNSRTTRDTLRISLVMNEDGINIQFNKSKNPKQQKSI